MKRVNNLVESNPIRWLGLPDAIEDGVDELYDLERKRVIPTIGHLTRLTAAEIMEFPFVGPSKLAQVRARLADEGMTLRLDPPLPSETGDVPTTMTVAEVTQIRNEIRSVRATLRHVSKLLDQMADSGAPDLTVVEA